MGKKTELNVASNRATEPRDAHEAILDRADVDLLAGSDQAYFPGLVVAVLSAILSLDCRRSCRFTVINGGFDQASADFLRDSFNRLCEGRPAPAKIVFSHVDLGVFEELPKMGTSAMAYARILAPSLIDAEGVFWVDSDMIVFRDLGTVFDDLRSSDCLLGGVSDHLIQSMDNDCPVSEPPRDPLYLNTGLLWMNLREMRQTSFSRTLLKKMEEWKASLKYWDQTALNYATPHRKRCIDASFNQFTNICGSARLVKLIGEANLHMISLDKPWKTEPTVPNLMRDIVFYRMYSRLTGHSCDDEFRKLRVLGERAFSYYARFKASYYKLAGDSARAFKWGERSMRKKDFLAWLDEADSRIEQWFQQKSWKPGTK